MTRPAPGPGPWGEAITFWLREKNMSQADLVEVSGLAKNTITSACLGRHLSTRKLQVIAEALDTTLEGVLISPERRFAQLSEEAFDKAFTAARRAVVGTYTPEAVARALMRSTEPQQKTPTPITPKHTHPPSVSRDLTKRRRKRS